MYFSTPPLSIIDRPSDARHTSGPRSASELWYIILHATAGPLESSLDWLTVNPNSNVSAHRVIADDGRIFKLVIDLVVANHVGYSRMGNKSPNRNALGIEFVNRNDGTDPYELAQLRSGVAQVIEWKALYGDLPVLYHWQIDTQGKTDPRAFPWATWNALYYQRLGELL